MKKNLNGILGEHDKGVLWGNAGFVAALCIIAILFTDQFSRFWSTANASIVGNFGWFYNLITLGTLVFCLAIALSKYGDVKLGADDEKPEYNTFVWVAMLFSASIGVGVYFYGAAEPVMHYMATPYLAEPQTQEALSTAMSITFFHWGFFSQGIYAIVGIGIGIAAYRLKKPFSYSSGFFGLLGEKSYGVVGKILNFLCVFCTVTGVATSTGMAVLSLSYVVQRYLHLQNAVGVQLVLLAIIFAVYTISTTRGLDKGMAKVSSLNTYICFGVMIFVLIFGPTKFILNLTMDGLGKHIQYLPFMAFWSDAPQSSGGWLGWWSVFYRAWSFAWAPFVGGFLARISRGRTVRQVVFGGIFLPAIIMYVWYGVMGGTSLFFETNGVVPMWEAIAGKTEAGFYTMLEGLPLTGIMIVIAFINLITFVVTSADSASLYVGIVCANGVANPTRGMKLLCAVLMAAVPAVLLIGGGLPALQTMSIVAGFPIAILTILLFISIPKMLRSVKDQERLPDHIAG